jgi:hypothetical protein
MVFQKNEFPADLPSQNLAKFTNMKETNMTIFPPDSARLSFPHCPLKQRGSEFVCSVKKVS